MKAILPTIGREMISTDFDRPIEYITIALPPGRLRRDYPKNEVQLLSHFFQGACWLSRIQAIGKNGDPYGIRTRISAVKGPRPNP